MRLPTQVSQKNIRTNRRATQEQGPLDAQLQVSKSPSLLSPALQLTSRTKHTGQAKYKQQCNGCQWSRNVQHLEGGHLTPCEPIRGCVLIPRDWRTRDRDEWHCRVGACYSIERLIQVGRARRPDSSSRRPSGAVCTPLALCIRSIRVPIPLRFKTLSSQIHNNQMNRAISIKSALKTPLKLLSSLVVCSSAPSLSTSSSF
jgi:hypothetical protein